LARRSSCFWAVAALPVLYALTFGPACWLVHRGILPMRKTAVVYKPLLLVACRHPFPAQRLDWYADLFNSAPWYLLYYMAVEDGILAAHPSAPPAYMPRVRRPIQADPTP
jgi:hypothetical protein